MKCCLTIAGSDSGGNAGVQADLRAFHDYGRHGCTVFAALTARRPPDAQPGEAGATLFSRVNGRLVGCGELKIG